VKPRVAVLYNTPVLPAEHPDSASEREVVAVAREVVDILRRGGFKSWSMAARPPLQRLVKGLVHRKPDAVFQLAEGFGGSSGGEAHLSAVLELMGLPYTGCQPEAQGLARIKSRTKWLLGGAGLPTATSRVVGPGRPATLEGLDWPAIVKLDAEDASLGIDQGSVVRDEREAWLRVESLRSRYASDILVESYLPGREFNVGVLALPEPEALPVAEVVHEPAEGIWPILTYDAKWSTGSRDDLLSPVRCPAEIDPALASRLSELALSAFRATGCRDYARVDFRLDPRGEPMILEVNPNPDLSSDAGLAWAIRASGRAYEEVIVGLARQAIERGARDAGS
jgi:D-alanine-D-alanine ligase